MKTEKRVDSIERLLLQVRRKQLLLCLYQPDVTGATPAPTLSEIASLLQYSQAECLSLAQRLQSKGLIEPVNGDSGLGVRLTPKGERIVQRMSSRSFGVPAGTT